MASSSTNIELARLEQDRQFGKLSHLPEWAAFEPARIEPGVNALLDEVEVQFGELEVRHEPTWAGLMEPLERLNTRLNRTLGGISHLLSVNYSDDLQAAYDAVRPRYVDLVNRMSQSTAIYRTLKQMRDGDEWQRLTPVQQRILTESLRGMERAGVHLATDARLRFQAIQTRLAELGNTFSTNLVRAEKQTRVKATSRAQVAGIPAPLLEMAAKTAREDGIDDADAATGPWHFVVNVVNYAVVTLAEDRALREAFYRAFRQRGQEAGFDNRPVLEEIVRLRQEMASLVGFANFVDYSLDAKMADSAESVWTLLNALESAAKPVARQELDELTAFARRHGMQGELAPWDVPFWAERLEQERYGYDNEALRAYFQLPVVLEGLFSLTERLYGVTITQAPHDAAPLWHPDVRFYDVRREGEVVAGFYLDPYARPGLKRGGAWMNIVVDRSRLLAPPGLATSLPVALMVMNARPPADGQPALMSLDEVRTLFHEFGHTTQLLFTEIDEGGASGLNLVEWDAVELASQFNEYWMDHKPFLRSLSRHVASGQSLDDAIAGRIIDGSKFMAGNATLRQLLFGKTDLRVHAEWGLPGSNVPGTPFDIESTVAGETLVLPYLPGESQLPAFTHLFSGAYAAGYYSYKWAEVLAADAFSAFDEVGLEDEAGVRAVATRFRKTVLAQGGSKPAEVIYREFRGRDATPDALLRKQGLLPIAAGE
ncbi:MAG: M3 family metallopeptidase [Pseudomonadales bacterium]|nr:M3 family metallopeptidase [Pseudomonadales bacterium]MCP5183518.1 M3 family metallopeptidase [Pseudomonadales bacterium]